MNTRQVELNPDHLAILRTSTTATLSTQLFALGLRNTVIPGLTRMARGAEPMVGEAFTLRYIPAREDLDVLESFQDPQHPQRRAIETCPPGHVLVMDCREQRRAASAGHILLTRLQARGAAGVVTDGCLRDTPAIAELDLTVYAAGASPMTNLASHHAVDQQIPIGCGGVPVFPGDVIVGDAEGVVCIPRHLVAGIAEPAAAQEALERFLLERVRDGAGLPGTYPPNGELLSLYRQTQDGGATTDGRAGRR